MAVGVATYSITAVLDSMLVVVALLVPERRLLCNAAVRQVELRSKGTLRDTQGIMGVMDVRTALLGRLTVWQGKLPVSKASQALRGRGCHALASRLGRVSMGRHVLAHSDTLRLSDVAASLSNSGTASCTHSDGSYGALGDDLSLADHSSPVATSETCAAMGTSIEGVEVVSVDDDLYRYSLVVGPCIDFDWIGVCAPHLTLTCAFVDMQMLMCCSWRWRSGATRPKKLLVHSSSSSQSPLSMMCYLMSVERRFAFLLLMVAMMTEWLCCTSMLTCLASTVAPCRQRSSM